MPINIKEPLYTVEQLALIKRLRESGITKRQVEYVYETYDKLDKDLGSLYHIPVALVYMYTTLCNIFLNIYFNKLFDYKVLPHNQMPFRQLWTVQHCLSAVTRVWSFADYILVTLSVNDDDDKEYSRLLGLSKLCK